jgi:hypothetical protein
MYPPRIQPVGVLYWCLVGAQRAAPFVFFNTGRLNPYPLLGAPRVSFVSKINLLLWGHPRRTIDGLKGLFDKYVSRFQLPTFNLYTTEYRKHSIGIV